MRLVEDEGDRIKLLYVHAEYSAKPGFGIPLSNVLVTTIQHDIRGLGAPLSHLVLYGRPPVAHALELEGLIGGDIRCGAIALRPAAMIGAIGGLSGPVRDEMFGSKWVAMRGLRNRIAHGYHVVDPGLHWLTVTEELPAVRKALENRLSLEEDG